MPSPLSRKHGTTEGGVSTWLGYYSAFTPGTEIGNNTTTYMLQDCPQPDVFLRILPEFGGQSHTLNGYVEGAPELVAEVAASSASYDLHDKLNAYRRNGVREYVVWRVWDRAIDWFVLRNGEYQKLQPTAAGWYRSEVFLGLWLDPAALIAGDLRQVLQVLQEGLNSPEHADFVRWLQARKK